VEQGLAATQAASFWVSGYSVPHRCQSWVDKCACYSAFVETIQCFFAIQSHKLLWETKYETNCPQLVEKECISKSVLLIQYFIFKMWHVHLHFNCRCTMWGARSNEDS